MISGFYRDFVSQTELINDNRPRPAKPRVSLFPHRKKNDRGNNL